MFLQTQNEQRHLYNISINGQNEDSENAFSQNAIWSAIENFKFAPEEEITFASYFKRYENLYNADCASWADHKKVRILLKKLGTAEYTKFVNYILPKKTSYLKFKEAVQLLIVVFSPKTSLFHKRWKCMNLTRKEDVDYTTFASVVNKYCDDFKLAELSGNTFKCLIFVQGLISTKDTEIHRRVLIKLENEPDVTLQ